MTSPYAPAIQTSPIDDLPLPGAGFVESITRLYQRYAVFSGRASRSEYWWVALFFAIVYAVTLVPGIILGAITGSEDGPGWPVIPFVALLAVVLLGSIIPTIALTVRRLHDANFSGYMYLLNFIPQIGSLIVFVLNVLPSSPLGARFDAVATQPGLVAPAPSTAAAPAPAPASADNGL